MYLIIDRNTSTVVYKGTLFMNESEYLDIDIDDLFSEENTAQREVTDIKISGNLYIRPLFTIGESLGIVIGAVLTTFGNEDIKALVNFCRSRIEIPTEVLGFVEKEARYIDSKGIKYLILMTADRVCNFNNPELLKMVLDLKLSIDISIQEMELLETRGGFSLFHLIAFLKDFGYTTRVDLLVYISFLYYLVLYQKKELIDFLENSYPDKACQQILFDMVIFHNNVNLVEEYFFKVESNSANIIKVTDMAYRCDREDLIRFLLNNSDKLKSDLDENAVMTAIAKNNYEFTKEIIDKYPKSVSIACLKTAVEFDGVRIPKLIIDAGVDLTSPEFEGIAIASRNKNIDMLQLLLESGATVGLLDSPDVSELCSIKNHEVAQHLIELFGKDKARAKIPEMDAKAGTRLKFNKTLLCLIGVCPSHTGIGDIHGFDFDEYFSYMNLNEKILMMVNSTEKVMKTTIDSHIKNNPHWLRMRVDSRAYFYKLSEIIYYIIANNLQSTLEVTGKDEAINIKQEIEKGVLNDIHYEIAKSELVNRNFTIIKLLIEYGMMDVNVNVNDSLILKTAYKAGDMNWIKYFIGKGAELSSESDGFEEACRSDNVEVFKHWIKNGGVVPKNPGYSCINNACLLGNYSMVELLVESGVDLSDPERNGVRIACRLGLKRILKYLLANNAVVGDICICYLERACINDDIELIKMFLEYYVGLGVLERRNNSGTKDGEELKSFSSLNNENPDRFEEYKTIRTLLEKGKPIRNDDLIDVMEKAIRAESFDILKLLLTYEIDFDRSFRIIETAVKKENIGMVELLLKNGYDVEEDSCILEIAIEIRNNQIFKLLLEHGAEISRESSYLKNFDLDDVKTLQLLISHCPYIGGDCKLLRTGIENNKLEAVKLILKDTGTLDTDDYNYVLAACINNNIEILRILFEKGAKIKKGYKSGVIQACENNNLEMLKLLFERNPNLVLKKEYGLKEACYHENVEMVSLLIKYDADTSNHIESIMKVAIALNNYGLIDYCRAKLREYKKSKTEINE